MTSRLMRHVMALRSGGRSNVPSPHGSLNAHASGADSLRILLVSGEQALGLGVLSPDLAFQGRLARRIADATGRGVDVAVVADPLLVIADAIDAIHRSDLSRFDAVLLMLGTTEAMCRTPVARFGRDIRNLLSAVEDAAPRGLSAFITTVPDSWHRSGDRASRGTAAGRAHANRLNRELADVVVSFDVTPLSFVSGTGAEQNLGRASATYDTWAAQLAPAISSAIVGRRGRSDDTDESAEHRRQGALDELGILDTAPESRFDRIVHTAKGLFGVDSAGIGLIDHQREWFKAREGELPTEVDRGIALCNVTIQQDGVLVVPDTTLDERFSSNPLVTGPDRVRFYAGYPIESDGGERVGALCVLDSAPREFSAQDRRLLRDLALLAQAELATGRQVMRLR